MDRKQILSNMNQISNEMNSIRLQLNNNLDKSEHHRLVDLYMQKNREYKEYNIMLKDILNQ